MGESGVSAIGARIRAERERRGISVRGLARDIGVSASLISQIETNKSLPSVSTLYAITTALERSGRGALRPAGRRERPAVPGGSHVARCGPSRRRTSPRSAARRGATPVRSGP